MLQSLPLWIGLGVSMFLPFLGLGAAIRPTWIPLVIGLAFSAIWIYGLGLPGFFAAAMSSSACSIFFRSPFRRGW